MAVETQSGIPCTIQSGDTVNFAWTNAKYPTSAWSAVVYLSKDGTAVLNDAATELNGEYNGTFSAVETAALAPGVVDYLIRYTETATSQVETGETGSLVVTANLATNQTPSFAQSQVTKLKTVLDTFNATDKQSVSFNGQSFTRAGVAQYRQELTYWESRVIGERRAATRQRGQCDGSTYAPRFK
jgi:hypothetical protein